MGIVGEILGTPLGYLMKLCYAVIRDYGLSIIVFTLLTKGLLLPVSLLVQKNSIKMIQMKPELDALKYQFVDDKDALLDAQSALYKKNKYNPFAGTIPLLLRLPLIFGLIDVVYRPLKHILHFPQGAIDAFVGKTMELTGSINLGSAPELAVLRCLAEEGNRAAFLSLGDGPLAGLDVAAMLEEMQSMNLRFLGIDLAATPGLAVNALLLIPILAALSALVMCVVQNRINVLQMEQDPLSKWGMTAFMCGFSAYFAFLVPTGVGLYWIFGNLFSIPVMYLVNRIYDPRKYIDYQSLNRLKSRAREEAAADRENRRRSRKDYRALCRGDTLRENESDVLFGAERLL